MLQGHSSDNCWWDPESTHGSESKEKYRVEVKIGYRTSGGISRLVIIMHSASESAIRWIVRLSGACKVLSLQRQDMTSISVESMTGFAAMGYHAEPDRDRYGAARQLERCTLWHQQPQSALSADNWVPVRLQHDRLIGPRLLMLSWILSNAVAVVTLLEHTVHRP